MEKWFLGVMIGTLLSYTGYAQTELDALSDQQLSSAVQELREFLSIPNNASFPDHVERNVQWCENAFAKRRFGTQRISTDGPPLLLATYESPSAEKTVLIYLQIDGQPVDTLRWEQDNPYTPVLKERAGDSWNIISWPNDDAYNDEWRIFARSASDAKGPVAMFLAAWDIMLKQGEQPNYNIKVIMDFEEELGSPHLPQAVIDNSGLLASDMLMIYDGPRHISNQPTLTFGARGITTIQLVVYGPRVPQHSGHYGNYAPNPAFRMAQLLASMKDEQGKVIIPGYYDGIEISREALDILRQVPDDEADIRRKLGIRSIDAVADSYQESIQYPSLNIRGLRSGWVRENVRTIIPSTATAEIDIRLVPESDSDRLVGLVRNHIRSQGYHFVEGEPSEIERANYDKLISFTSRNSYAAFRTEYDTEIGQWLNRAMNTAFGSDPIRIRIAGGSIPISPFVTTLGIPAVLVPTVNPDNNQHSPNENLRIGNLREGIKTYLAILLEDL